MSTKQKLGAAVLALAALLYARPDLLSGIEWPDLGGGSQPGHDYPTDDQHDLTRTVEGVDYAPGDAARLAAIFEAVSTAIVVDGSLEAPRIATRGDAADLVAVVLRYGELTNYRLGTFAAAMRDAIGSPADAELDNQARTEVAEVYQSAAAAFASQIN